MTMSSLDLYRWMVRARLLDRALCAENPNWFPIEGEEATVVGAYCDLLPTDVAAPHYRDPFVVYLMRGAEMWRLAAQVLRKGAGYNQGRSVPFNGPFELGIVPWVAGDLGTTLGTATGAALALQDAGTDDAPTGVCVCAFGDGTANRGDFHENVNLAACWNLPIVYLCQHNGWAISEPATLYLAAPIVDRAAGYGIPGVAVDGNDVEAVRASVQEAIARARRGEGPTLIEARTWRQRGHWGGDAATYRHGGPPPSVRDPIGLQSSRLIARNEADLETLEQIELDAKVEVAEALARAQELPEAGLDELGLEEVFA